MTEDELVAALRELCVAPVGSKVVLGIGDDAAAWRPSRSNLSVISTDALLENVHFTRAHFSFEEIGRRAMASNLSDIAAMGARPVLATVALCVPESVSKDDVLRIYRGLQSLASEFKTAITGGDLVRSTVLMLSVTVIGEVSPRNLKRRDTARAGDVLAVSGPLGASRAGFELASNDPAKLDDELRAAALAKHRTPPPRVHEGRWLGASQNVRAMMDLSDGLARDVPRLAAASGLAATLEHVPVSPAARVMATARGLDPQLYACEAGEDFELLVAVKPRAFRYLSERFEQRFGHALYRIGVLHEGTGVSLRNGSTQTALGSQGWDHFAS